MTLFKTMFTEYLSLGQNKKVSEKVFLPKSTCLSIKIPSLNKVLRK